MSLGKDGFLSPQMKEVREAVRARHVPHFALIYRVNAFGHEMLSKLKVFNRDPQQLIAACLMLKIFEDVQGSVILLEYGLNSQGRSLLRIATEALIILLKVASSEEFFKAYVLTAERERLKFMNAIKAQSASAFAEIRNDVTDLLIEQVKKSVEGTENKHLEKWAKDVELDFQYDIVYRIYSKDVHTDPRVLEKYLVFREDGEVGQIGWGPDVEKNIGTELFEAAKIMTVAMEAVGKLFELNIKQDIRSFWAEIKELNTA